MLNVETQIDFTGVGELVANIITYAESGDAEKTAAHTAKAQMVRRTEQGKDADGNSFEPYAESTKKRKKKRGQQTSPVNLRDTGNLLESFGLDSDMRLRAPAQYDKVIEGLTNDSRPGRPHRKFIGATQSEADVMAKDIVTDMKHKNIV